MYLSRNIAYGLLGSCILLLEHVSFDYVLSSKNFVQKLLILGKDYGWNNIVRRPFVF